MMKFMQKKMNKKGFTLIELIVVIAVIGILVLLAAPRFLGYVKDAQVTRIMHDVKVVDNKVEETLAMDKEAFNAEEVTQAQLLILVNEGKLFDLKGQIVEPDNLMEGDTYKQVSDELVKDVRTKLKGKFYLGTGGKMYYEHTNSIGVSDVEEPVDNIYLAQDSDFSGASDGAFNYNGEATTVKIPHVIKGVPVTSYKGMFQGTSVTKVISDNPNITNMDGMFSDSKATTLDLSSFDTSNVTNMSWMFYYSKATALDLSSFDTSNVTSMEDMFFNSPATTGYARTQADADKFNSSNKPTGLVFTVK